MVRCQSQHLFADYELDRLGLRRVEQRLAGAGQRERALGVDDRERLVEAVDIGARRFRVGRPVGAEPEIAVANREQGAGQPTVVVTEAGLHQPPGVDREPPAVDCDRAALARHGSVSPRSSTTMSAPAATSASRLPPRSTPITIANLPARPDATP